MFTVIETFPFKEIDGDIQQYGQHLYMNLNCPVLQIKDWLDKNEPKVMYNIHQLRARALKIEDEKQKEEIKVPASVGGEKLGSSRGPKRNLGLRPKRGINDML